MLPSITPVTRSLLTLAALLLLSQPAAAERSGSQGGAAVRIRVIHEGAPLDGAVVRSGGTAVRTGSTGEAVLRLSAGTHSITANKLGFRPDTLVIAVAAGRDTAVTIALTPVTAEMEGVVVSAARSDRRVESTPIRVEVIDEEEIAEKVAMTPGDISMMLNETSGLRVQTTSSLGGANVRINGLRGRYTLILADGLPIHGGATGGLGILQIPPVDLGRVEVVKGSASALYGSSALGGVINLVSRVPTGEGERTILLNQTTRGGSDVVWFSGGGISESVNYTLLAGGHTQRRNDVDGDGYTDMPGYNRGVVRPRVYITGAGGSEIFATAGFTSEERKGGTVAGASIPGIGSVSESQRTTRTDGGAVARLPLGLLSGGGWRTLTIRTAVSEQRHEHTFPLASESDRHLTVFGEGALALHRGNAVYVLGLAAQRESYRNDTVPEFDFVHTVPAVFGQLDLDVAAWLSLTGSARLDAHSEYGESVSPRLSLLFRSPREGGETFLSGFTARLSGGIGSFAPTPFTEETERGGLATLLPLGSLRMERAATGSLDMGGAVETGFGAVELNATAFAARVRHPLFARAVAVDEPGGSRLELSNAVEPTVAWGGEVMLRLVMPLGEDDEGPVLRVTSSYAYTRSSECVVPDIVEGDAGCVRRVASLTPRHSAGTVVSVEEEGRSRVGLEVYYTGSQVLYGNPYRAESDSYVVLGLLAERAFEVGGATLRLFANFENLTDVRQTRVHPYLLPQPGEGGRWTTDVWSMLDGRTVNAGVRWSF